MDTVREITITKILDAPRELVFAAWTDAEQLARWWGPEGYHVPEAASDPRPGGALSITMRGPDGTDHVMTGTYREIDPPARFVTEYLVVGDAGLRLLSAVTTVTLIDHDGKTELTVHERAEALAPDAVMMLGGMEVGMTQSLRRLDDVLTGAVERQIVLARLLEAPRDRVFEAFVSAEQAERWWGPNGFSVTTQEMDVRPGGTWRFTMRGPDGVEHPNLITYDEVAAPELLSWANTSSGAADPGFHTAVTLDDFQQMTVLTMRIVFASAGDRDATVEKHGAIEGGNQTLERLARFVVAA